MERAGGAGPLKLNRMNAIRYVVVAETGPLPFKLVERATSHSTPLNVRYRGLSGYLFAEGQSGTRHQDFVELRVVQRLVDRLLQRLVGNLPQVLDRSEHAAVECDQVARHTVDSDILGIDLLARGKFHQGDVETHVSLAASVLVAVELANDHLHAKIAAGRRQKTAAQSHERAVPEAVVTERARPDIARVA